MKTIKFTEAKTQNLKRAIHIVDMLKNGSPLYMVKEQAEISGFEEIANAKFRKQAYTLACARYESELERSIA
tara:strand:+ start:105261 stop:105476 length:216 start_codon:yes stop_codon:yes gene_type:complete